MTIGLASGRNFRFPDVYSTSKLLKKNDLEMVGATGFEPVTSTV